MWVWISSFFFYTPPPPPLPFSVLFVCLFEPRDLFFLSVYAQLFHLDPQLKNRAKLNRFPISG